MSFVFGSNDKMMKLTFVDCIRIVRLIRFCAVIAVVLTFTEAVTARQNRPAKLRSCSAKLRSCEAKLRQKLRSCEAKLRIGSAGAAGL